MDGGGYAAGMFDDMPGWAGDVVAGLLPEDERMRWLNSPPQRDELPEQVRALPGVERADRRLRRGRLRREAVHAGVASPAGAKWGWRDGGGSSVAVTVFDDTTGVPVWLFEAAGPQVPRPGKWSGAADEVVLAAVASVPRCRLSRRAWANLAVTPRGGVIVLDSPDAPDEARAFVTLARRR